MARIACDTDCSTLDEGTEMTRRAQISRRSLLQAGGAATALCVQPTWAQRVAAWPDPPVSLIVPYPTGGSADVLFRILAERLRTNSVNHRAMLGRGSTGEIRSTQRGRLGRRPDFQCQYDRKPLRCQCITVSAG